MVLMYRTDGKMEKLLGLENTMKYKRLRIDGDVNITNRMQVEACDKLAKVDANEEFDERWCKLPNGAMVPWEACFAVAGDMNYYGMNEFLHDMFENHHIRRDDFADVDGIIYERDADHGFEYTASFDPMTLEWRNGYMMPEYFEHNGGCPADKQDKVWEIAWCDEHDDWNGTGVFTTDYTYAYNVGEDEEE